MARAPLEVEDPVRSEPRDLPQDQGLAHAGQPAEDERRRARPRIELRPDGGSVGLVAALQPDGPLEAEGPQEPHHGARSEPSAPAVQHDRARPQRDATLGSHPRVQCLDALGRGRAHHVDRVERGRLPARELTDLPHEVVDASLDQGLAVAEARLGGLLGVGEAHQCAPRVIEQRHVHGPRQVVVRELRRSAQVDDERVGRACQHLRCPHHRNGGEAREGGRLRRRHSESLACLTGPSALVAAGGPQPGGWRSAPPPGPVRPGDAPAPPRR